MRFGVHVSIGGGLAKAVDRARELGCEAFQIFAANPRGWARKPLPEPEAARFREARAGSGLGPVVVHLAYLPNIASLDTEMYEKSLLCLAEDFSRANRLGAEYFVLHPGSCPAEHKAAGLERAARGLAAVLAQVQGPTRLLLENQGSRRRDLAADLDDLGALMAGLDPARTGVCLDTCHAFAAGYDLRSPDGWRSALDPIRRHVGLERLCVIHANDSRGDLGSGLDRHEHIGAGTLGEAAFAAMGSLPELSRLAVILETPQDSPEDDPRNLAAIRRLTGESR